MKPTDEIQKQIAEAKKNLHAKIKAANLQGEQKERAQDVIDLLFQPEYDEATRSKHAKELSELLNETIAVPTINFGPPPAPTAPQKLIIGPEPLPPARWQSQPPRPSPDQPDAQWKKDGKYKVETTFYEKKGQLLSYQSSGDQTLDKAAVKAMIDHAIKLGYNPPSISGSKELVEMAKAEFAARGIQPVIKNNVSESPKPANPDGSVEVRSSPRPT